MISRIAKQIEQDSDRHTDRDSASVRGDTRTEVKDNGTNKSLRDAQVPKMTSAKNSDDTATVKSIETRQTRANAQDRNVAHCPPDSNQSSHFIYFPQNYKFRTHYSHPYFKSNQYRRNKSYHYRHLCYQHCHPYPPPQHSFATNNSMAPFDDTTLATSNISKKKETGAKRYLTIDTTHNKSDMKQRNERHSPHYPQARYTPRYGEYYHHPGPYHGDVSVNMTQGHHSDFYDSDPMIDYEYPFSTTPIAINTPQRSNLSFRVEPSNRNGGNEEGYDVHLKNNDTGHDGNYDARWKEDHNISGHYEHPPRHDHNHDGRNRVARSTSGPPQPPHEDRRQLYSSAYNHNGWRVAYEHHPQEAPYHPQEPYDRHYFSPSPPPPPPYPDYLASSSEAFMSRAASPSMSWYEGSRGSYDEQDVPIRAPIPHYYSKPTGGYHYPNPPPPEQEDRPGTPLPNQSEKTVVKVTPRKMTRRNSPTTSNNEINTDQTPSFLSGSKAIVTPGDKSSGADSGASTFAPSSPFLSLRDSDIVCGRGAPTNFHIGNSRFRELVLDYNKSYFIAKRSEKPRIAMKVLDVLASQGARFVRRVKGGRSASSHWEEVAHKIAYEKVCQALRDAGGSSRRMLSSVACTSQKRKLGNSQSPMRDNGGSNKRQRMTRQQEGVAEGEEGKENCVADDHY